MTEFDALLKELDQWNFAGEEATLWWRDDDAVRADPHLDRLLDLLGHWDIPVALAVIPEDADRTLVDCLQVRTGWSVLQHGIQHRNHAGPGQKKQEIVSLSQWNPEEDLLAAWHGLSQLFPSCALPVLVPPWNRVDDSILPMLPALGYRGLSCFGPRRISVIEEKLQVVNTHVDLIDWKEGRSFVGTESMVRQLTGHLRARREERVDREEPTGILSHHLVQEEGSLECVHALLGVLDDHPAVTWLSAGQVFHCREEYVSFP